MRSENDRTWPGACLLPQRFDLRQGRAVDQREVRADDFDLWLLSAERRLAAEFRKRRGQVVRQLRHLDLTILVLVCQREGIEHGVGEDAVTLVALDRGADVRCRGKHRATDGAAEFVDRHNLLWSAKAGWVLQC